MNHKAIIAIGIAIVVLTLALYSQQPFYDAQNQCKQEGYVDGGLDKTHGRYCIEKVCPFLETRCAYIIEIMEEKK